MWEILLLSMWLAFSLYFWSTVLILINSNRFFFFMLHDWKILRSLQKLFVMQIFCEFNVSLICDLLKNDLRVRCGVWGLGLFSWLTPGCPAHLLKWWSPLFNCTGMFVEDQLIVEVRGQLWALCWCVCPGPVLCGLDSGSWVRHPTLLLFSDIVSLGNLHLHRHF